MKICSKCGQLKWDSEFPSEHETRCKHCRRDEDWKRRYGITPQQYLAMYNKQDGCCAICKRDIGDDYLAVDHDKITGKVRGLLCRNCNVGIGMLGEDISNLMRAIQYLEESEEF